MIGHSLLSKNVKLIKIGFLSDYAEKKFFWVFSPEDI